MLWGSRTIVWYTLTGILLLERLKTPTNTERGSRRGARPSGLTAACVRPRSPRGILQLLLLLSSDLVHGLLDGALVALVRRGHCNWSNRRPMEREAGRMEKGGDTSKKLYSNCKYM